MLISAWDVLSTQIIMIYFQESRISTESQKTTIAEDEDSFWEIQDKISDFSTMVLETEGGSDNDNFYSSEVADEPLKYPEKNELLQVIETLERFFLFQEKGPQSNLTLVTLKVKLMSTLLRGRSKHSLGIFQKRKKCFRQ